MIRNIDVDTQKRVDLFKQTHEGFRIICENCGSEEVYLYNSLGYSAGSGTWGSLDFICANCDKRSVVYEAD